MARGGVRIGAGRPEGSGRYKEKTKPIRIPESMLLSVSQFIKQHGYKLPLFYSSKVLAEFPSSFDEAEKFDLNELLIKHYPNTFLFKVAGESMVNIGINDQDLLIVNRQVEATNNKIVVVTVDGELTIKRLNKTKDGKAFLVSENQNYPLLEVSEKNNIHIWGVVTTVIHSLV